MGTVDVEVGVLIGFKLERWLLLMLLLMLICHEGHLTWGSDLITALITMNVLDKGQGRDRMTNHSDNMIRDFPFAVFSFLICELMFCLFTPSPPSPTTELMNVNVMGEALRMEMELGLAGETSFLDSCGFCGD